MNFESIGQPLAIVRHNTTGRKKRNIILSVDGDDEAHHPFNELQLDKDEHFQLIPNPTTERQILYITGQSGSGKSYFTKKYCEEFRRCFPHREIYLISSIQDDASIDDIPGLHRIKLAGLLDDDITAVDFKDSMVIFDDTDCITDKKLRTKVNAILGSVLETGRHFNVYVIYTSHLACAGLDTRRILNECSSVTFFPSSMGGKSLKYLMEGYFGLDKHQINRIKQLKTRAVTITRSYPKCVISERNAFCLTNRE